MAQEKDETWTTRDGRQIAVGDMEESHVRNALRMVLRRRRLRSELCETLYFGGESFERPDNHAVLADLRARHGDAVRVSGKSVAGMGGGDVYVGDEWVGWFGGI